MEKLTKNLTTMENARRKRAEEMEQNFGTHEFSTSKIDDSASSLQKFWCKITDKNGVYI